MYIRSDAVRAAPAILLAALLVFPTFSNLSAGGGGARDPPGPDGGWFFVPPTEKVGPNAKYENNSAIFNGTTILLSAARGEHEAFQAVEWTVVNHTGNVSMTAFTGASGIIPVSRFEFYQVWYPTEAQTEWPDPLIPILQNQPLVFTNSRNNVFLIDIFVPETTQPGTYSANFSIWGTSWPVALTVWDITLPERNTLQTWFDDSPSSWASAYGYAPWSAEHVELMKNVSAQYKKFRLSPGNIDLGQVGRYNMTVQNGVVSVDFSGTDPWLSYCLDVLNFTSFRFPLTGYSPRREDMDASTGHPDSVYFWGAPPYDMNPTYADHIGKYIKLVADHYRQKGWLDKAYVYVTDEPIAFNNDVTSYWQHPDYHVVQQFFDLVKANAPDLKFINTVQPVPELFNCTDVWAVPGGYYHELDAQARMNGGQSVWWYNVDAGIASDGVKGRALYWDTFSRGVEGVLYWGTNYWDYDTVNGDPWKGSNSNGDGYLFYPGKTAGLTEDVCPSLRLFLARDGLEDFELLNLYAGKYGVDAARALSESVAAGSSFAGARFRSVDVETIYEIREWLAGQIMRKTTDLSWTDTFKDSANVSAATYSVLDPAWEGSWALGPSNPPMMVDNLDAIGGWRPNNQPHIFSSVAIDTAVKTEGAGSLRIDFWRDDDPGELGGYGNMRNGRVVTNAMAITDWSGFKYLEMDVRSVDHPAGNLFMLVGDAAGAVVSSDLHRYSRYTGGPGDNWTHIVIDISGKSRSSIQYIEPIVYNYFLEIPFRHYTYWLDNITVRMGGVRPTGSLLSMPIDLGNVGRFGSIEYITPWVLPNGDSLPFETRTSADSVNWSAWTEATPDGRFRAAINSPAARFIQYRAHLSRLGQLSPGLSEVRIGYSPITKADLFVENMTFDPPVPNENETFNITVSLGNNGDSDVPGAWVEFSWQSGETARTFANVTLDVLANTRSFITVNWSEKARPVAIACSAELKLPPVQFTDPEMGNNTVIGWVLVNDYPSPAIDAPATALVGDTVFFNASGSTDLQGIERCLWSFADLWLEGLVVNRSFGSAGITAYTLTVADRYGACSRQDGAIAIFNHTPVPSFVVTPENGTVLTSFTFISTVFDPESTVQNTTWLFGDGLAGFGRVVNHTFSDDRSYTVDCTVDFSDNGTLRRATASLVLKIGNLPPAASFTATNNTAIKRRPLGFDAGASSDPDDSLSEESFSWLFGDGGNATGRTASHSFTRSGAYNVSLTVTDDDGARSSFVLPVKILNLLPAAEFLAPGNVTCNRTFTLDASGSSDPDGTIVAYRWEFDDGTNGTGSNVSHYFSAPGLHAITLVVTDDDGAAGRLTKVVRADPAPKTPQRPTGPAATNSLHPAVYIAAGLLVLFIVLFAATRARPRPKVTSRWSMARPASGRGEPASARGPPPAVPPATVVIPEPPGTAPPAAPTAPAPASAPFAVAPATYLAPAAQSRQPPRVVRTISPPPPRLVRAIPAPPDTGVIELGSAPQARVIDGSPHRPDHGRTQVAPGEPWRLGAGAPVKGQIEVRPPAKKEHIKSVERSGEEADPTLPSNPWAEKGK